MKRVAVLQRELKALERRIARQQRKPDTSDSERFAADVETAFGLSNELGDLLRQGGQYEAAVDMHLKQLQYAETLGSALNRAHAYRFIFLAWEQGERWDEAMEMLHKGRRICEENKLVGELYRCWTNMSTLLLNQYDSAAEARAHDLLDRAESAVRKASDVQRQVDLQRDFPGEDQKRRNFLGLQAKNAFNHARVCFLRDEYEDAAEHADEAIVIATQAKDMDLSVRTSLLLADVHANQREYGPAVEVLVKAQEVCRDDGLRLAVSEALGSAYLGLGQFGEAVTHYQRHVMLCKKLDCDEQDVRDAESKASDARRAQLLIGQVHDLESSLQRDHQRLRASSRRHALTGPTRLRRERGRILRRTQQLTALHKELAEITNHLARYEAALRKQLSKIQDELDNPLLGGSDDDDDDDDEEEEDDDDGDSNMVGSANSDALRRPSLRRAKFATQSALGQLFAQEGRLSEAKAVYEGAAEHLAEWREEYASEQSEQARFLTDSLADTFGELATVSERLGDMRAQLDYIEREIPLRRELKDSLSEFLARFERADALRKLGRPIDEVISAFEAIRGMSYKHNEGEMVLKSLAALYKQAGDTAKIARCQKELEHLKAEARDSDASADASSDSDDDVDLIGHAAQRKRKQVPTNRGVAVRLKADSAAAAAAQAAARAQQEESGNDAMDSSLSSSAPRPMKRSRRKLLLDSTTPSSVPSDEEEEDDDMEQVQSEDEDGDVPMAAAEEVILIDSDGGGGGGEEEEEGDDFARLFGLSPSSQSSPLSSPARQKQTGKPQPSHKTRRKQKRKETVEKEKEKKEKAKERSGNSWHSRLSLPSSTPSSRKRKSTAPPASSSSSSSSGSSSSSSSSGRKAAAKRTKRKERRPTDPPINRPTNHPTTPRQLANPESDDEDKNPDDWREELEEASAAFHAQPSSRNYWWLSSVWNQIAFAYVREQQYQQAFDAHQQEFQLARQHPQFASSIDESQSLRNMSTRMREKGSLAELAISRKCADQAAAIARKVCESASDADRETTELELHRARSSQGKVELMLARLYRSKSLLALAREHTDRAIKRFDQALASITRCHDMFVANALEWTTEMRDELQVDMRYCHRELADAMYESIDLERDNWWWPLTDSRKKVALIKKHAQLAVELAEPVDDFETVIECKLLLGRLYAYVLRDLDEAEEWFVGAFHTAERHSFGVDCKNAVADLASFFFHAKHDPAAARRRLVEAAEEARELQEETTDADVSAQLSEYIESLEASVAVCEQAMHEEAEIETAKAELSAAELAQSSEQQIEALAKLAGLPLRGEEGASVYERLIEHHESNTISTGEQLEKLVVLRISLCEIYRDVHSWAKLKSCAEGLVPLLEILRKSVPSAQRAKVDRQFAVALLDVGIGRTFTTVEAINSMPPDEPRPGLEAFERALAAFDHACIYFQRDDADSSGYLLAKESIVFVHRWCRSTEVAQHEQVLKHRHERERCMSETMKARSAAVSSRSLSVNTGAPSRRAQVPRSRFEAMAQQFAQSAPARGMDVLGRHSARQSRRPQAISPSDLSFLELRDDDAALLQQHLKTARRRTAGRAKRKSRPAPSAAAPRKRKPPRHVPSVVPANERRRRQKRARQLEDAGMDMDVDMDVGSLSPAPAPSLSPSPSPPPSPSPSPSPPAVSAAPAASSAGAILLDVGSGQSYVVGVPADWATQRNLESLERRAIELFVKSYQGSPAPTVQQCCVTALKYCSSLLEPNATWSLVRELPPSPTSHLPLITAVVSVAKPLPVEVLRRECTREARNSPTVATLAGTVSSQMLMAMAGLNLATLARLEAVVEGLDGAEELDLSGAALGAAELRVLRATLSKVLGDGAAPSLRDVKLASCSMDDSSVEQVVELLRTPGVFGRLRRLDLSRNGFSQQGMRALLRSRVAQSVCVLDLSGNPLGDQSLSLLRSYEDRKLLPELHELRLRHCGLVGGKVLRKSTAKQFAGFLHTHRDLEVLDVAENPWCTTALPELLKAAVHGGGRDGSGSALSLDLSGVPVASQAACVPVLSDVLRAASLQPRPIGSLALQSWAAHTTSHVQVLAELLQQPRGNVAKLRTLNLRGTCAPLQQWKQLFAGIAASAGLTELNVSCCSIADAGPEAWDEWCRALCAGVQEGSSLRVVSARRTPLSEAQVEALQRAAGANGVELRR